MGCSINRVKAPPRNFGGNPKPLQRSLYVGQTAVHVPPRGRRRYKPAFPNGRHLCELETDRLTILRCLGVDDLGPVVDPLFLAGQVQGSIVPGSEQRKPHDADT